jgi:hypothetical protein
MQIIDGAGVYGAAGGEPVHWAEHPRVRDKSVGPFSIPAGGTGRRHPTRTRSTHQRPRINRDPCGHRAGLPGSVIRPGPEEHRFTNRGQRCW